MKHAVSTLEGALLDAAVMLAEGPRWDGDVTSSPSSEWWRGGPFIENERIEMCFDYLPPERWLASCGVGELRRTEEGPTPLIAAMRAFVASKLGDEVEL